MTERKLPDQWGSGPACEGHQGRKRWKTLLPAVRRERGIPLRVVSAATGISVAHLSQMEYGCAPSLSAALRLARFYGKPVEELWTEETEPAPVARHPVKLFTTYEVDEAQAHAAAGGQALHLHAIIPDRAKAPWCFVREVDAGRPIAHLFDQNEKRLRAAVKRLGVRVVVVERPGKPGQHVDLCAGPLRRALDSLEGVDRDRLPGVLAAFAEAANRGD